MQGTMAMRSVRFCSTFWGPLLTQIYLNLLMATGIGALPINIAHGGCFLRRRVKCVIDQHP